MEGKGFRDRAPQFAESGAEILGISYDSPAANKKFREKFEFPYALLSDTDKSMSEAYGAKQTGLKKIVPFPKRVTYLINPDGKVAKTYEVSDTQAHPETVLCDLQAARDV